MSNARNPNTNVFESLDFDQETAALLKVKSYFLDALIEYVERFDTQAEAAEALGISQPQVSYILNGKLSAFTSDWLIRICGRLGLEVDVPARFHTSA